MKKILTLGFLLCTLNSYSNGINVSAISFNDVTNELSFTLTWENSFTMFVGEPDIHDAAWVWVKYAPNGGDSWFHATILDSVPVQDYFQYISYDDLGIMIFKVTEGNGTFGPQQFTVELGGLTGSYQDFKVFATETVYVDDGDFFAGDAISSGRFYQDGNTSVPWEITSEDAIMRGNGNGEFDQEGSASTQDLNANFPKGYNSFFCMKYKITAQQYVDFLNCLTRTQQDNRVQADLSGTTASGKYVMTNTATIQDRNPIACNVNIGTGAIEFYLDMNDANPPNSSDDGANVALNYLTPADIIAYLDWSGMRPMTELEYEKICRGTDVPSVGGEFAWGTDTWNPAGAITSAGTANESTANVGLSPSLFKLEPLRAGYAATAISGRTDAGGTFWGALDIHNLGEFMYGVESLQFSRTSYGDGNLSAFGGAVVPGWTVGAQLLSTQDPAAPAIEPISMGKNTITPTTRSAYMGARGVRKLILE